MSPEVLALPSDHQAERRGAAHPFRAPKAILGHLPALDGVRGLAVALVMLLHFVGNTEPTTTAERVVVFVSSYGMLGVDLFFVLSGFLITGILFDTRFEARFFRNFYVRRTLRIFPLYYGTLFVFLAILPALLPDSPAVTDLHSKQWWLWLYGANVLHALNGDWALSYLNHFWSLAIEEHFYLAWPLIVWSLRRRPEALMWTSLGIAVASRVGEVLAIAYTGNQAIGMLTPLRLSPIALGCFLAMVARAPSGLEKLERWVPRIGIATLVLLVSSFFVHRFTEAGQWLLGPLRGSLFVALLACILVLALTAKKGAATSRLFRSRPLVFLGKYSYGLYVYHHFVSYYFLENRTEFLIAEQVGSHTLAVAIQATVGTLLSIFVAVASFHFFERRFLSLKKYFEHGRAEPISAPVPRAQVN